MAFFSANSATRQLGGIQKPVRQATPSPKLDLLHVLGTKSRKRAGKRRHVFLRVWSEARVTQFHTAIKVGGVVLSCCEPRISCDSLTMLRSDASLCMCVQAFAPGRMASVLAVRLHGPGPVLVRATMSSLLRRFWSMRSQKLHNSQV